MSVASHFQKSDPVVLATYQHLLKAARTLGPVVEEHFEVRLKAPADVDKQLMLWLSAAYALSGR